METNPAHEPFTRPDVHSRFLTLDGIEAQLGFLQGEILTLAEATLPDPAQCKAFKDIAKQFFRSRIRHIGELSRVKGDEAGLNPCVNVG